MLCQCFPPAAGGIQTLMADLAHGLALHHPLRVITKQQHSSGTWDSQQPYPITRISGPKFWRRWMMKYHVKGYLSKHNTQAIITDSWKSAALVAKLAKTLHTPIITLTHGNDMLCKNKANRAKRIRQSLQACQHIVSVSTYTAQLVERHGFCSTVIHSGIKAIPLKSSITPDNQQPILLTIARLEARKGIDRVIEALPHLSKQWPNMTYVVAGSGSDLHRLQALAKQLGVTSRVRFLGRVDEANKALLLAQADLFVMPVRHDTQQHSVEGFGISLIEAQMAKCPVLTGQSGGVSDVIQHGITGYTCDGNSPEAVCQQIMSILQQPEAAKACAQRAYNQAQARFTHEVMIQQYLALIGSVSKKASTNDAVN